MIEDVLIRPYALPLRRAWGSSRGGFDRRHGWLVRVRADGLQGYGDCAPLPEAGTESPDRASEALRMIRRRAVGRPVETLLNELDADLAAVPAARFALDCALGDLLSQQAGLPLRHWLSQTAVDVVPVNAMLGRLDRVSDGNLLSACAEGFQVLKIKVGCGDPGEEIERLRWLAARLPAGTSLRLDANGAWDLEQARTLIGQVGGLPIECIEEPLRHADPEPLAGLQAQAPFALARDESLRDLWATQHLTRLGVKRLVLKPAVIGGLQRTLDLARRAAALDLEVVVTGLVESAAGLWPTAQLAAAVGSPIPQGLATASWLADDTGPAPHPKAGRLHLPATPGSGFAPRP